MQEVIGKQWSVIGNQESVIGNQESVSRNQWSVIGNQWSEIRAGGAKKESVMKSRGFANVLFSLAIAVFAVALLSATAQGALITGITLQDYDGVAPTYPGMGPLKAINGSGLPSSTPALSGTHTTTWSDHWYSNAADSYITVDLEGNYALDKIHLWNYNESAALALNRGFKNTEIWVSANESVSNLVKLSTNNSGEHDNGSGDFLFPAAPGNSTYTGFDLDLTGVTNALLLGDVRLIRIKENDTYGGGTQAGLAEVQFGGTLLPSNVSWTGEDGDLWDTSTTNWNGSAWNNTPNDTAIFGAAGTAGDVEVNAAVDVGGLTFNTTGYRIADDEAPAGSVNFAAAGEIFADTNVEATLDASLTGSANVSKTGAGTVIISENAASGYTGTMTVGNGDANSDGTLDVSGSFGGNLTVGGGGTLAVDETGANSLNLGANQLNLNDGAVLAWQFLNNDSTDNYDQIISTATGLLGSGTITIHVEALAGASVKKGDTFTLYKGDVSFAEFGNFTFNFTGYNEGYWNIARGGSLILTSTIPEPSTMILAGLGLAGLSLRRRRQG